MTSRGRYSQSNEWESRDEYNSSVNEASYLEDDSSADNLDHCRLYIRNIPKGLNEVGLRAAFAKFGTLVEVFHSKDPVKNYGLIRFETPGEAKLAMMKMNRTEPLRLQINIAYKSKSNMNWQERSMAAKDRSERSIGRDREETGSVVSRSRSSRVPDETANGDNNMDDLLMEDDYGFSDILDPNLHLELENLKLEQLKVREEQLQCKQRVILLKQAERKPQMSNRCLLPDGKIVVRNTNESSRDSRDADVSFTAGAGDSRVAVRQCVVCGSASDAYCAGCGITPYCTERCQRRDWHDRHRDVCHNLARMHHDNARASVTRDVPDSVETRSQVSVMPLRRPHTMQNNKRDNQLEQRNNSGDARSSYGGNTSKGSVKSYGSNERDDRYNSNNNQKQRQPYQNRNNNNQAKENELEMVFPTAPSKPAPPKELTRPTRNMFTVHPTPEPAEELKKVETVKPAIVAAAAASSAAAAAAKQHNLVPKKAIADLPPANPEVVIPQEVIKAQEVVKLQQVAPPRKEISPQEVVPPRKEISAPMNPKKPGSVSDVTPVRRQVVPKLYLLEKLQIGSSVMMSVDAKAADCRITRGDFVCLTMAEAYEMDYHSLCEDLVVDCNKDDVPAKLAPGETIAYFNPDDCGWYRARCLNPTTIALLDSGKIVTVTAADKCRKLPSKYEAIPEFCAVLSSKTVQLGASLNCKILAKTSDGFNISMSDVETEANIGEAEVFRWFPTVEYPPPPSSIPEVKRPPITDGCKVLLVLATTLDRVFVRPVDSESQRKYNDVLQQVLLSAMKAKPLTEPPSPGQTVIGKFTDGLHYRALVRRINVKQNKYQIEYAEYGNIEVSTLENLYPCPADFDLSSVKTLVAVLKLAPPTELSDAAKEYVAELVDTEEELVLSLPSGRSTAPSGSEAKLTIAKSKVDLGELLVKMCTPEWKKIEQRGGDVVETEHVMYNDIEHATLPLAGCTVNVMDISTLRAGCVCAHDRADPRAHSVYDQLTAKMAEYCNSELGREPYLPKPEELCVAQMPPYPQWFRAVFLDLVSGPGSSEAKICYLDYGNIAIVPVTVLRKMMPEFIKGYPIMGLYLDIRDFPEEPSDEMLARALQHMKVDEEGKGTLQVSNCVRANTESGVEGSYLVDAPELLKAMKG